MKAIVDSTKCGAYGACVEQCPSVFHLDDWGYASVIGDGAVPAGDETSARDAATACPEGAIGISD